MEREHSSPTHLGGMISYTAHATRRALDARIAAEVTPELSGARGMLLGEVVSANRENRPVYQRDVEQWYHIRRSSVTTMLQGMEQDGFIIRRPVERDARLKSLVATEKGVAYTDRIHACVDTFDEELTAGLSSAEQETTKNALQRILKNLAEMQGEAK